MAQTINTKNVDSLFTDPAHNGEYEAQNSCPDSVKNRLPKCVDYLVLFDKKVDRYKFNITLNDTTFVLSYKDKKNDTSKPFDKDTLIDRFYGVNLIFKRMVFNRFLAKGYYVTGNSYFDEGIVIKESIYLKGIHLYNNIYNDKTSKYSLNILDSYFDGNTEFHSGYFKGLRIENSQFNNFSFEKNRSLIESHNHSTIVTKYSLISGSRFNGDAIFASTIFRDTIYFRGTSFEKGVVFKNTIFTNHLGIINCTFKENPAFENAQMPFVIELLYPNFVDDIQKNKKIVFDFRKTSLDSLRKQKKNQKIKCFLFVTEIDGSRLLIPYDRFNIIFYEGVTYEMKHNFFESLVKNCRDNGMVESAIGWDVEYRKLENSYKFGFWGDVLNFLNERWWNFGYDKWRILVFWLPGFFCCFLLYNFFRINTLWNKMYKDKELGASFRKTADIDFTKSNWRQRLSFTFFYTAVIYFGFKIRHDSVNYNYTRGLLYLYFMYAVGTIHMAFAFSYILSAY